MNMEKNIEKLAEVLEKLNIGKSFRIFGGLGLLTSLSIGGEQAIKISLITFIFGALARVIEMLNKLWPKNIKLQAFLWTIFIILYSLLINSHIKIFN